MRLSLLIHLLLQSYVYDTIIGRFENRYKVQLLDSQEQVIE